jgi:hypothetical protein
LTFVTLLIACCSASPINYTGHLRLLLSVMSRHILRGTMWTTWPLQMGRPNCLDASHILLPTRPISCRII